MSCRRCAATVAMRRCWKPLARAVQATLGIDDEIDLSTSCSFAELGGDSLSALSCSLLLEEIYGIEVPASVINNPAGNLQQVAAFIERARSDASNVRRSLRCMAAARPRSARAT